MAECEGHPAGPFDLMGQTVYCDGSCVADDTAQDEDPVYDAADAILAEHGAPLSREALRTMLALAYGQGVAAGLIEAREMTESASA